MIILILLSSLIVQLLLALLPGFKIDEGTWYAWSLRMAQLGPANFYSKDVWTQNTPGLLYLAHLLGIIKLTFNITDQLYFIILKLPSIFANLLLSFLVYRFFFEQHKQKTALTALLLLVFNPVLIFNASIWGQLDSILALLIFLSVYYLDKLKIQLSSFFLGLALLFKPQAISLLPVFAIFLLKNFSFKNLFNFALPAAVTVLLLALPFFPKDPVFGLPKLILQMSQDYNANSLFAYNIWGIFGFWIDDRTNLWFLPYQYWGYILLAFYWLTILFLSLKNKPNFFVLTCLALLSFYFLPTRVHERYLLPALPFLYIVALIVKSRLLLILSLILSFLHLLNLYYVYVYYNEVYLKLPKLLYISGFYELIEKNSRALSFISSLCFILIVATIIKLYFLNKRSHFHVENEK